MIIMMQHAYGAGLVGCASLGSNSIADRVVHALATHSVFVLSCWSLHSMHLPTGWQALLGARHAAQHSYALQVRSWLYMGSV
jgi:hypothetical protein